MRHEPLNRVWWPAPWLACASLLSGCADDAATAAGESSSSSGADAGTWTPATSSSDADTSSSSQGDASSSDVSSESGVVDTTGSDDTASSSESTSTGGESLDADLLFTMDGLARIDLTLDDAAIESLWASSSTYVHAGVQFELATGEVVVAPDIGARLKGVYGSFRTLDQKAAFLLHFDEFVPDEEPLGLEKLALNNMVQDPSMIHEQLAYALFRDAGVPAPRTGYARVFVNGELYGLYSLVEPADNSAFLDTWFGDDEGNLYEGEYGSDLYPGWGSSFDLDNGVDVGFADLEELAAALDGMSTPATFVEDVDAVIDIGRYLSFAATEIFIGHWDGYAWTRNNYHLYRGPDLRWTFIPWGTDQTFFDHLPIWGGDGRIEQMCGASMPCREQLADAFVAVGDRVVALGLVARCDELLALIDEAMQEDPRKEYGPDTVYWGVDMTRQFLLERTQTVEDQLVCVNPNAVDEDGDDASGCGYDCDDGDPLVYPGAPELCNVADDNCNGVLDDDPGCPQCVTVPADGGGTLAYCFTPRNFADAEADCIDQGGHLVSIHDQARLDEVVAGAFAVQGNSWWIGLDDLADEGSFVWTDGTPLDFESWAPGEPNDYDQAEDCAHVADWAGGSWNDLWCDAAIPYVCLLP